MHEFGISFFGKVAKNRISSGQFVHSLIKLGLEVERGHASIELWSREQYLDHWVHSAGMIFSGEEAAIFCGSLEPINADTWVGLNDGKVVRFYNSIQKTSTLNVSWPSITPFGSVRDNVGDPEPHWSCWEVPIACVKALSEGGGKV